MLLDVDDFKEVNDERGHQAGDRVLEQVGAVLQDIARETDVVGRYGGEEFGMGLPQTGPVEAAQAADRAPRKIEGAFDGNPRTTVSVGVASRPEHGTTRRDLIRAADAALYHPKRTGKNRSTLYPRTPVGQ